MNATADETKRTEAIRPTLRDKSMAYTVRYLFNGRFEVESKTDKRRYYVEGVWFEGDVLASCRCADKTYNKAAQCKHELSVIRFERSRVAMAQFN